MATTAASAGCASDPTGIDYSVASLFDGTALGSVVVRVYARGSSAPSFCGEYLVDEGRPPGDSISLVNHVSTLSLSPVDPGTSDPVRIVAEGYSGIAEGACEGGGKSKPRIRKVAVVPYAKSRVLSVHALFEASCLDKLDCDETTSTCSNGACVSATSAEATGSVASPECFDVRSCPSLERATRSTDACSYTLPKATSRGYVAVTFRFEGGDDPLEGAAVLSPGEFTSPSPGTVTLAGRMCELATRGTLTGVYFGYECTAPEPGSRICAIGTATPSPIDVIVTGPTNDAGANDAGTNDATADRSAHDGDTSDVTADGTAADGDTGTRDASGDAPFDVSDGDASGGGDSGGGDSGGDGGSTPRGPHSGPIVCGATGCDGNFSSCCLDFTPLCLTDGMQCASRFDCDDRTDCSGADVCCEYRDGMGVPQSACRPAAQCQGPEVRRSCGLSNECDPGELCTATPTNVGPSARWCTGGKTLGCFGATCSVPDQKCCEPTGQCEGSTTTCTESLWCDDPTDCNLGEECCLDPNVPRATCVSAGQCPGNMEILCRAGTNDCGSGVPCIATSRANYALFRCSR
ncbi:MAG: hypothetical protein U0169_08555 [Polyangiaceae bacterium]